METIEKSNKEQTKADGAEKYTELEFGEGVVKIIKDTGEIETHAIKGKPKETSSEIRPLSDLEIIKKNNPDLYQEIIKEAEKRVGGNKKAILIEAERLARTINAEKG